MPEVVDGPAGVSAPIKQPRPADIQSQHALFVLHQILGVLTDDHTVLHPDDLRLENSVLEEEEEEKQRGEGEGACKQSEGCWEGREQREEETERGEIRSTF